MHGLHSTLFADVPANDRRPRDQEVVAERGSRRIRDSGLTLNPADRAVWESLLQAARELPVGESMIVLASTRPLATGQGIRRVDAPF